MSQLYGLFIVLRALFPLFFVAGLYLILRRLSAEALDVVSPHLDEIDERVGNIRATLAAGQTTVEAIEDDIGEIASAVDDVTDSLTIDLGELEIPEAVNPFTLAEQLADLLGAEITPTLEFAEKTLTDTYNVLGLGQVKDVFESVLEVMEGMASAVGIAAVTEDVGVITGEIGNLKGALLKLWLKWGRAVRWFFLLSLAFLVLIYGVWLARSLIRGFALLAGLPDPGPD
jgi:hypothetical protein